MDVTDKPRIVIKITGTTSLLDENQEDFYTVYDLKVTVDGTKKKVSRRFREFRTLNTALLREFAFTPLPAFPFNAWAEVFIGANYLVSSRITELEKWLNTIVQIPKVASSHFVTLFLNLYDLSEKVAIVTGANSGLGKQTALSLAQNGCQVILACRSPQRGEEAAQAIRQLSNNKNVTTMPLDLSSISSIKKFVQLFKESFSRLDFLVNNAGLANHKDTPLTEDGFNLVLGVNYIGTVLLTTLLFKTLSKDAKIVSVSSGAALSGLKTMKWGDQAKAVDEGALQDLDTYSFSKLILSVWTQLLADKLKKTDISVFTCHPGVVGTEIFDQLPQFIVWGIKKVIKTADEGVESTLYCLLEPSLKKSSGHYIWEDCSDKDAELRAYAATADIDLYATVWDETKRWLASHCDIDDLQ